MLVTAGTGALIASTSLGEANSAILQAQALDEQGRHVVVVTSTIGALDGAFCEKLRLLPGVLTSFGSVEPRRERLATGRAVSVIEVTSGFEPFLQSRDIAPRTDDRARVHGTQNLPVPELERRHETVFVGAQLAYELGLVQGSRLSIDGGARTAIARTIIIGRSPRTRWFDDAMIVVGAPNEAVARCVVELEAASRATYAATIPALAPSSTRLVVTAFAPDVEARQDPEERLSAVAGSPISALAGSLCAVGLLGWCFVRRTEWALYVAFGLTRWQLRALVAAEWVIIVCLPLTIGAAWATGFVSDAAEPLAVELAAWNVFATAAYAGTAIPIWWAYLNTVSPSRLLRSV